MIENKNIDINKIIDSIKEDLLMIYTGDEDKISDALSEARSITVNSDYFSEDDFSRKFSINLLKQLIYLLKNDILDPNLFTLDMVNDGDIWSKLRTIILIKRIEELKRSKVVRKGKKYDISDLKSTYLGNLISDNLGFSRRNILEELEYEKIVKQCRKLKYEVPITIEPTVTEKFFSKKAGNYL